MNHYSCTDPWGMDGWVGHVGWPIADDLTTKWVTHPASSLVGDRESSPAETSVLTTMLCRQQHYTTISHEQMHITSRNFGDEHQYLVSHHTIFQLDLPMSPGIVNHVISDILIAHFHLLDLSLPLNCITQFHWDDFPTLWSGSQIKFT